MQLWLMASAAPSASPRPDRNGAMLLDRLGPPGFRFRFIDFRAPRLPYLSPLARARALLARPWSARCYGVARQREGSRQNSIGGPRFPFTPASRTREGAAGQAVVCPLLRGSSPTRGVAPKQHRGLGRAFTPAFFGLVLFIPWRVGAEENLARRRSEERPGWRESRS